MSARSPGLTRRGLLQAGGALLLPLRLGSAAAGAAEGGATALAPNAFVRIGADDSVRLTVHRSEMGQGIRTTLAMVLCDELDADWSRVSVEQADGDARYGDQDTVGDYSLLSSWQPLRQAAATARALLLQAASQRMGVPLAQLRTEAGRVMAGSGTDARFVRYGDLVALAATLPVPASPVLKTPEQFRLIGRPMPGIDLQALTTGRRVYGLDVQRPGLRYAVIERAPLPAVKLKSFDASAARAVPGVQSVFALPATFAAEGACYAGVAIVADDSWACLKARRLLRVEWDRSALPADMPLDSAAIRQRMDTAAAQPGVVFRSTGDVEAARRSAARTLARRYHTPFLAHVPLEPPNCTAEVRADGCEVWAPTQNPGDARERIAAALGLPLDKVTVHVMHLGGGFGRKSMHDFVLEAVRISREAKAPVKLFWTREDDLRHGYYRSASVAAMEGGLDAQGELLFWRQHTVHSSQQPTSEEGAVSQLGLGEAWGGMVRTPYAIAHQRYEGTHVETPLKRAWLRGVQDGFHAFAANCFLDELATLAGRDPLAWRLALLAGERRVQFVRSSADTDLYLDTARYAAVMRRVAEMVDWPQPRTAGRGLGLATHVHGPTYVAMVAEVQREGSGWRLERVACAVDCGLVVNPDGARAQVEGAILFGLSCCLHGGITLADGAVQQGNFHDHPVARIGDAPRIEVAFVPGGARPVGLGEPCVPAVAPALANAIAAAGLPRPYDWPLRAAG
ncbi:molybdopterin cofactor-binding domain-containing protein [Aquabacterium sp.]|uniref:xanthine dehydrogenase family protein molybdopterin-binding subunit n=1 Tax=Aquabacterium sp. TaxID=1872578 RepID=UPI003783BCC5